MPVMKDFKTVGIYLIIILAIMKFVLVPINNSLNAKKTVLNEYLDTYRTRSLIIQKYISTPETEKTGEEKERFLKLINPKDSPIPVIQSKTLSSVIEKAEKNGLTVLNFELPDAATGKNITEVPLLVRLKGTPKALTDLLKDVRKMASLTEIKGLQIEKSGDEFLFTITLTTYRVER
jgi:Tfp pilus assembly protein PilO